MALLYVLLGIISAMVGVLALAFATSWWWGVIGFYLMCAAGLCVMFYADRLEGNNGNRR